jgi:hypothetical protein
MKSRDAGSSLVFMIIGLSFVAGGLRMGLDPSWLEARTGKRRGSGGKSEAG